MVLMVALQFIVNQSMQVEKIPHQDHEIEVYVIDEFLENPGELRNYAANKAYFGAVGDDGTAYPGIRDRLPGVYEKALQQAAELVYEADVVVHRCMLSLTTLPSAKLRSAQKMPHVDAFGFDQYATVHFLCGPEHGGTAIYRYLPANRVRLGPEDRHLMEEMLEAVQSEAVEHDGYLVSSTSLFRQELCVEARFNRLVLYPSNLLHCAVLDSPQSISEDVDAGRLTVASFFKLSKPQ